MKHLTIYDNYDFLGMQAAQHGMTREEWIAVYGSGDGINESKFVMTYERYVTYDKLKNWGVHPPSEVENELREKLVQLFIYGGISNHLDDIQFTDMSSEKGIKWEIQVKGLKKGSDVIHVYKRSVYRMDYEWYLNKKKSSTAEIQKYFLDKYVSKLDQYLASIASFDRYYDRADDHQVYLRGSRHADRLLNLYQDLSGSEKKKAYKAYLAKMKDSKKEFKDFRGI